MNTTNIHPLPSLPVELIGSILSYCPVETIALHLQSEIDSCVTRHKDDWRLLKLLHVIKAITKQRFLLFSDYLDRIPNYMPCLMSPFIKEYASASSIDKEDLSMQDVLDIAQLVLDRLCVLDYFEQARTHYYRSGGAHEWLVWSGPIILPGLLSRQSKPNQVHVAITSPCWYPGLVAKWKQSMNQCHSFENSFSSSWLPIRRPLTHVARISGVKARDSYYVSHFNNTRGSRHGEYALPVRNHGPSMLNGLVLTNSRCQDLIQEQNCFGNQRAFMTDVQSAHCCDNFALSFWTDLATMDRMRNHKEFTKDIVELQSQLSKYAEKPMCWRVSENARRVRLNEPQRLDVTGTRTSSIFARISSALRSRQESANES